MHATRRFRHILPSCYFSRALFIEVASFSLYFFTWKLCMSVSWGVLLALRNPAS